MFVKSIQLRDFRNYQDCYLELSPHLNILIGDNAQGKTNLLESIYFLSTGRSHRTSSIADLARWDSAGFLLQTQLIKSGQKVDISFNWQGPAKRTIKINHIPQRKISSLLGIINTVLFSPEDLQLLKGSPAQRRRFLDIELSQVSPVYLHTLQQYNRILAQRNNMLREKGIRLDRAALSAWDEQLVSYGSKLTLARKRALQRIESHARVNMASLTTNRENLGIAYKPWGQQSNCCFNDVDSIAKGFWEMLKSVQRREIERGQTLIGPHRDDFSCLVNGIDIQTYGSQGQQRTCVLALKLAEIEFMKDITRDYPILLLDDVLSELDDNRRRALLSRVDMGVQTVITGTEAGLFKEWIAHGSRVVEVESGSINIVS